MGPLLDQMGRKVDAPVHPQRIISLVPSQTELLFDLGLGDRVVGITKFCVHPEAWFRTKPRVGGTKNVDLEMVRALKPDLIIGNKEENERADIDALAAEFPVWMSDVRHLESALDMIHRIGMITGTVDQAGEITNPIRRSFRTLAPLVPTRTAAYFIWQDPLMVVGGDTYIADMMRRCGLVNAFEDRTERYAAIMPHALAAADPDVILLSSEPYPFTAKHIPDFNMIRPGTPVRLVDGEYFSWYGSRSLQAPDHFRTLMRTLHL